MIEQIDFSEKTQTEQDKILKDVIRQEWPQDSVIFDTQFKITEKERDYLFCYFNSGWRWDHKSPRHGRPFPNMREFTKNQEISEDFWRVIVAIVYACPHVLRVGKKVFKQYRETLDKMTQNASPIHIGLFGHDIFIEDFILFKTELRDREDYGYLLLITKKEFSECLHDRYRTIT